MFLEYKSTGGKSFVPFQQASGPISTISLYWILLFKSSPFNFRNFRLLGRETIWR
jgi:hypothetical protein